MKQSLKGNKPLIDAAREYGAREPWRVAAIIQMAVHFGREPNDVLDEVRRNDPSLFYGSRHEQSSHENSRRQATGVSRRER